MEQLLFASSNLIKKFNQPICKFENETCYHSRKYLHSNKFNYMIRYMDQIKLTKLPIGGCSLCCNLKYENTINGTYFVVNILLIIYSSNIKI